MKTIRLFILFFLMVLHTAGQDIHFSQIHAAPLMINPAQTGRFNEQLRAGLVYRNQGASISVPYKTYAATVDAVIAPPFLEPRNTAGAGLMVFHDDAGEGSLQLTSVYLTSAFHKGLNPFGTLVGSLGFSIGLANRSVDFSRLVFGNQWNGFGFDTAMFSGENYSVNSFFYLDLNFGLMLSYKISNRMNFSGGVSLSHINKPYETFYSGSNQLGWKWIFHGNGSVRLRDNNWHIEPGLMYFMMNGLDEMLVGSNVRFGKDAELQVIGGLWYRWNRDVIPTAGVSFRRYTLMFSYDITTSSLRNANNYQGGFEISLTGRFYVKTDRCDNVKF